MGFYQAVRRAVSTAESTCSACRRTLVSNTSTSRQAERSATTAIADDLQANSARNNPFSVPATPTTSAPDTAPRPSGHDVARAALQMSARSRQDRMAETARNFQLRADINDYGRQQIRRWKVGDVYAPHDLSGVEMNKWKRLERRPTPKRSAGGDAIDQLGINPIDHYKNFAMMSEYMSPLGRIKSRQETGLRPVNQRKMAKAIRRAVGIGLIPSVHHHPEILKMRAPRR